MKPWNVGNSRTGRNLNGLYKPKTALSTPGKNKEIRRFD